jgi:tetratricopeptide (TPR) repeat protein
MNRSFVGRPHFYLTRRNERTTEDCRGALEIDPAFFQAHAHLGLAYEQQGNFSEAMTEFQTARTLEDNPYVIAALGHALAASGDRDRSRAVLAELKTLSAERYVSPFHFAIVHGGLGENDRALEWLEKACQDRSAWLVFFKSHTYLDSVRHERRFRQLLRSIGLVRG